MLSSAPPTLRVEGSISGRGTLFVRSQNEQGKQVHFLFERRSVHTLLTMIRARFPMFGEPKVCEASRWVKDKLSPNGQDGDVQQVLRKIRADAVNKESGAELTVWADGNRPVSSLGDQLSESGGPSEVTTREQVVDLFQDQARQTRGKDSPDSNPLSVHTVALLAELAWNPHNFSVQDEEMRHRLKCAAAILRPAGEISKFTKKERQLDDWLDKAERRLESCVDPQKTRAANATGLTSVQSIPEISEGGSIKLSGNVSEGDQAIVQASKAIDQFNLCLTSEPAGGIDMDSWVPVLKNKDVFPQAVLITVRSHLNANLIKALTHILVQNKATAADVTKISTTYQLLRLLRQTLNDNSSAALREATSSLLVVVKSAYVRLADNNALHIGSPTVLTQGAGGERS